MKVAIYFGEGYEEIEALSVVDVLRRAQVEVVMVGVKQEVVASGRGICIHMDTTIDKIDSNKIDVIVLPGGVPGIDNLLKSEKLIEDLKKFKAEKKWIAAICAAPSILGRHGLLKGERATCYPGYERYMEDCEHVADKVVISGKIITGMGAGTSLEFAFAILENIKGKEIADSIKKDMLIG